ncbi:CPBP family intramembrane glutamic endopeptidase [Planococcus shixiaomingii]|uniref:CPBP family intramembrane glutamic endopeptidase n=1 Tax=Planococcus shixiaomingii TaxID=3058393 RepID=UPI00263543B2|nr:type II CAAX endopeptidase family protein [Planococcus sp. N022]WKA55652.1 type II CAAX endopeptidase family protein [Planococcus sp. N022]
MFEKMKLRYFIPFMLVAFIGSILPLVIMEASLETFDVVISLVVYILVPAVFFGYYFRKQNVPLSNVVFFKGIAKWLPSMAGIVLISILFSISIFWLQLYALLPVAPGLVSFFMEPIPIPETPWTIFFLIFSVVILAPIAEEFMFRGLLLKRLIGKTSVWGGIILSSFFFGILHADILGAFAFGVIASLLYLQTGNLLIPILLHMLNNSLAITLMFLAPPDWPTSISIMELSDITSKAVPNAILLGVSMILMVAVIIWLIRGLRKKTQEQAMDSVV